MRRGNYCTLSIYYVPQSLTTKVRWESRHTMTLRYPEVTYSTLQGLDSHPFSPHFVQEPTSDERDALNSYFHLTSRLYPCGECAAEFQALLKKFPPQVTTPFAPPIYSYSKLTRHPRHHPVAQRLSGELPLRLLIPNSHPHPLLQAVFRPQ